MDALYQQILTIVSTVIGSIDVVGIIGVIIYVVKANVTNSKLAETTKETIETAFKDAVLPKNIKLDVSSKIEQPIKEGLATIQTYIEDALSRTNEGEQLILQILSLFSHVKQLPTEVQEQIQDFLEKDTTEEVTLE